MENVGEPKEEGETNPLLMQIESEGVEVESLVGSAIGMNGKMPQPIYAEVTVTPTFNVVEIKGITNGPMFFWNPRILPGRMTGCLTDLRL